MNAAGILEDVADTYSRLQTVAAEALVVNESLDGYTRSEQRVWCHFEAPDRVRIEHKGDNRMVTVRGGGEHVTYFGVGNHFARHAVDPGTMRLPGDFSPDMPMIGEPPFLFRRIAERVKASEVVEQSPGKVLVRVDYDSPQLPFASTGPLLFSVDTEAKLISRVEVEVTHRRPHDGGVHSSKQVLVITRAVANEPIEPETFVFVPPPDAEEMQPGIRSGGFGGGGRVGMGSGKGTRRIGSSRAWSNGSLVDTTSFLLKGVELSVERRFQVSEDGGTVEISERFTSPAGEAESVVSLPLAKS